MPAVAAFTGRWRRLGLLTVSTAILFTWSRGGILGLGLFYWLWRSRIYLNRRRLAAVLLLAAMVLGLGLGVAAERYVRSGRWAMVVEARERIAVTGLLAWREKPLFGWGWSNFSAAFESLDWPYPVRNDVYVDKAHSGVLEILVTTGVLGLAAYLTLVVRLFRRLAGLNLLMLVLYLWHSQTNVISVSEELLFWILLGLGL